jgi:hypothetical protein
VAIAAKSAYPVVSPGAFTPVAAPPVLFGQSVEYEWVEPLDLIRSRLEDFDAVLVGRNAVGGGQVGHQSEACKKLNISVLLDLDDDELQPRSQTHNGHPRS